MNALGIAAIVFVCVFSSAMLGLFLHTVLPEHHLKDDSKDIVKLGTGLIATLAALVLGLLISSAKGSFDKIDEELVQSSAKTVLLDRVLARYGPETKEVRAQLKRNYASAVERLFSDGELQQTKFGTHEALGEVEDVQAKLRALSPQNDSQRWLQSRALEIAIELSATRWLLLLQKDGSISVPFLVVLVFWLSIIFAAFGLFAPSNVTVVTALLVCALSVSGAIFLILEMERPLDGLMRVSSAPMRDALAHLGQ